MGRTDGHGRNEAPRGRTRGAGAQASAARRTLRTGPIGPPLPGLPPRHAAESHPRAPAGCQPWIGWSRRRRSGRARAWGRLTLVPVGAASSFARVARRHVDRTLRCHARTRLSPRGAMPSRGGGRRPAGPAARVGGRGSHRCSWLRSAISTESSAHDCDQRALGGGSGSGSESRTALPRTTRAVLSPVSSAPLSPRRPTGTPESGALVYERCSPLPAPRAGLRRAEMVESGALGCDRCSVSTGRPARAVLSLR